MSKRLLSFALWVICAAAHGQLRYHLTELGPAGNEQSASFGINASGQVAGWIPYTYAFLNSGGVMQNLGTLGGEQSEAYGLNDSGQVVGFSGITNGDYAHAFLYSGGVMQDLGTLGGTASYAYGINASGQITGWSYTPYGSGSLIQHAFLYSNGIMQDLGAFPGTDVSYAMGINNSGQIVGGDWIYSNGSWQNLGSLGGDNTNAFAINASGQVVGQSYTSGDAANHAFLYSNGTMQDLTPGGGASSALAINSLGDVVGYTVDGNGQGAAFLYSSGVTYNLNNLLDPSSAGAIIDEAIGINDNGLIAASGSINEFDGQSHALLLTPIAENVILPDILQLPVGTQSGGALYSLQFEDRWYLSVQPGVTTLLSEAPVQVLLYGDSPTMNPTSFQFTLTGHVNSINLTQSILLYNYQTGSFETLNTTAAHVGSDQTVTVTPTGNLSRFVNQSNGLIKAQVNFSRAGFTSVLRWTASLGVANWIIQ